MNRLEAEERKMADRIARHWLQTLPELFPGTDGPQRGMFDDGIPLHVVRLAGERAYEIAAAEGF